MTFLHGLIEKLFEKYSKDIVIQLDTDVVQFRQDHNDLTLLPIIFIEYKDKKHRVIGVGEECVLKVPHFRIEVFNFRNIRAKTPLNPEQCLTAFFSHAFRKLMGSKVYVRPNVKIHNIDRLTAIFPENKEEYLERVLIAVGARKREFL